MFNIGDRVKLVGVVKDTVTDTPSGRVSVLIATDEMYGNPSKEYWLQESHLSLHAEEAQPAGGPPPLPAEVEVVAEPQAQDEE